MRYFEMFAGIGSFRAGVRDLGWECTGWAEIDRFARTSYGAIFPAASNEWNCEDVSLASDQELAATHTDILLSGFPCQDFSIAGNRSGFEGTRGTLFFEVARYAKAMKPTWIIAENVPGLLNHDHGRTFRVVMETLNEIGYVVDFHVYDATEFDVPQNRERVFIVGKRCDVPFEEGCGTAKRPPNEWRIRERLDPSLLDAGIDFFWFPFPAGSGLTRRLVDLLEPEVDEKYFLKPETEAKVRLKLKERREKRSGGPLSALTQNAADALHVYNSDGIARTLKADVGGCDAQNGLYTVIQKTHSATTTIHNNGTGTLQAARLDKVPMVSVPVVRRDDGGMIEYGERDIANTVDANNGKDLDNHGQRTGVAVLRSSCRDGDEEWDGGEPGVAPALRAQWGGQVSVIATTIEPDVVITSDARGTIKEAKIASTVRANAKGNIDMVYVRSARFHGREPGLELEERDDDVAHCLSSASGGASKGFVTLNVARTVRATRGRSYDDKHSQTLVPVLQFADAVADGDQDGVMIVQRARGQPRRLTRNRADRRDLFVPG